MGVVLKKRKSIFSCQRASRVRDDPAFLFDHRIPYTEVIITGSFVSTKKGKVYLEYLDEGQIKKKNCTVTCWDMNPANGASEVRFILPKLGSGDYTLRVTNKVGTAQTVPLAIIRRYWWIGIRWGWNRLP